MQCLKGKDIWMCFTRDNNYIKVILWVIYTSGLHVLVIFCGWHSDVTKNAKTILQSFVKNEFIKFTVKVPLTSLVIFNLDTRGSNNYTAGRMKSELLPPLHTVFTTACVHIHIFIIHISHVYMYYIPRDDRLHRLFIKLAAPLLTKTTPQKG